MAKRPVTVDVKGQRGITAVEVPADLLGGGESPAAERRGSPLDLADPEGQIANRGMPEGFSASWVARSGTAEIVQAWAEEVVASAPPRTELDFAEHMQRNLNTLVERLGGIPPA